MDMREERLLSVQLHTMRHSNVGNETAGTSGLNRLLHCLLCSNTLQHRVGTDPLCQILDSGNAFVTALGDDVGCAKFTRELLSGLVAAHRNNSLCPHLLGREHPKKSYRTIADDHNGRTFLDVRRICCEPACAEYI